LRVQQPDDDEELNALPAAYGNAAKMVTFLLTSLRCTPRSRVRPRDADSQTPKVPIARP
jgi:hypothetical protein